MHRIVFIPRIILLLIIFLIGSAAIKAASNIEGVIKDTLTNEPLIGANVILVGTSLGAATDEAGQYIIRGIESGTYVIRVTYIGYETVEKQIQVKENADIAQDFNLKPIGIEGETVIITAQASGQVEAINKQLSSDNIMNAVSSARIQELPDANAAESIGRLPGVSVLRSGGEGDRVVIRGLDPKYNQISVNGVQLSSSNPNDRSTDLSMISPYMLESIEVSKTITSDMDANVIGGTVNFELREAKPTGSNSPSVGILAQGSYNGLSNANNKYNNYKYVGSVENRFFSNKLGVFALLDIERRNLTSNELGATYDHKANSKTEYIASTLNLNMIPRDRKRYNGAVVIDYNLPDGNLKLANFLSTGTTDIQNRGESFNVLTNLHNYSFEYSNNKLGVITNILNFKYDIPIFHIDADFSHTYSETKSPNDWTIGFQQGSAGLTEFVNVSNLNPIDIPKGANNDTNSTYLGTLITNNSFSKERALTASLDFQANLNISNDISSAIKFGGRFRHQTRSYVYEQSTGQGLGLTSAAIVDSLIASHFSSTARYANTTSIPILPFVDPNYDYGEFLEGDYKMILPLNFGMLNEAANFIKSQTDFLARRNSIAYFRDMFNSTTFNYSGYEDQSAVYAMATINIGPQITIIPGIRFQNLHTNYTAPRGTQNTASATGGPYLHYDTTVTVDHGYWLPNLNVRYKPFNWFDVRLSYTNTLAYPDYNAIVPRIDVAVGSSPINYNNYQLSPTRSKNYDAYFSFYENSIGLFTVGGYLKQIHDLIYSWSFFVSGANSLKYYPPSLVASSIPTGNPNIINYVNNPHKVEVWGLELDWQTHFWYLPHPFDGLVLNVNYTHVYSEAKYPYTDTRRVGRILVYVDTIFTDRLLYQPDNIFNLSLGYDYEGFSIRASMLYQADIFAGPNFWPQLRSTTDSYTRWDLAVRQELPWFGIQIFGALNNINSAKDINIIQAGVPQSQQHYGMTADVGLRLKL